VSVLRGKRLLVTGGGGFLASHLVARLLKHGAHVAVVTKYDSPFENIRLLRAWNDITVIECDIRNIDSLRNVREFAPEIVFHFAAYNHVGDSFVHVSEAIDSNFKGTANLLESYDQYDRFIYISSSEIYGAQSMVPFHEDMCPNPISPYAIGKYAGELYCRMKMTASDRNLIILRPFNAFGPYQNPRAIIPETIIKCLKGMPIESTEGRQTRDFNYISNLVDGFIEAATSQRVVGETVNLGSGEEISIADMIRLIHCETASSSELRIGKLPYRPTEIWRMAACNGRAQELMGWVPRIDLREGLRRTIEWYRNFLFAWDDLSSPLSSPES
jgi:UDP-glucose 4-epimerase